MKKFFWISALCVGLSAAALFAAPVGAASAGIRRGGACGALREEAAIGWEEAAIGREEVAIGREEVSAPEVLQKESAEVGLKDASASAAEPLAPVCKAAYLCDWRSGTPVYKRCESAHLPIASMCKIMTMLLCFEAEEAGRISADEPIAVSERAAGMGGSQVFLEAGASYPAGDLLESICIASANDSCVAMAERLCGSERAFVQKMNERARELGMTDTNFVNCTGLPANGQYSCARDVALMLGELLRRDGYFRYSRTWMDEIRHPEGRVTQMANTNKLLRSYVGCDGGKTGYTAEAGFCIAATAARGDLRAISVVIGAPDSKARFAGAGEMFDYIFANYTSRAVLSDEVLPQPCEVVGGRKELISVRPARAAHLFCAADDTDAVDCVIELPPARAPIAAGDVLGRAVIYKNGVEADSVPLLANEDAARRGYFDSLRDLAQNWNY